jgi:hypothetical protein
VKRSGVDLVKRITASGDQAGMMSVRKMEADYIVFVRATARKVWSDVVQLCIEDHSSLSITLWFLHRKRRAPKISRICGRRAGVSKSINRAATGCP